MKKNKYAIVSTWNGEGYSFQNKLEEIFAGSYYTALKRAEELMYETQGQEIKVQERDGGFIFNFIDSEEDHGSFQAIPLEDDSYGIIISCMENEVEVLNKLDYHKKLEEAILNSDPEMLDDDDFEGFTVFVHDLDGYDLQFIEL